MKILICQPKLESGLEQLEYELHKNPFVDAAIFPEGYLNENIVQACELAQKYNVALITGYRNLQERPKDRAVMINRNGTVVIDRIKYSVATFAQESGFTIGHILCDELVIQGLNGVQESRLDLIVHPIGVGMFSEEQFDEWIGRAREIAIQHKVMVIGTSHADGSFGDTGISIPIAYCFDKQGDVVFISKNDVRTRILDMQTKQFYFA
ncbi:hypothetical protein BVG16_12560 [Paenibacillus selenitireducens]|uniref:CN hydrolase domain-containing protein n=1 Tax=Paenibacillus selenitireducens TaxID=1324314 RepID=A0A1T2XGH4_9BACL|nr:hypothetical protein [Paenibacillus selenitireducens]OPA78786.1 hypothetical protein BVG16_12560 [Paenibacillus selenitireducens]